MFARVVADGRMMEVARMKITEAGRRALTGWPTQRKGAIITGE
jgi:hypothetical protein